jgi:hypothetical protein
MAGPSGMWSRFRDEVRSVSHRTRRGARRAFDAGVIRVDVVSLSRDRRRALADLGERLLTLWQRGPLDALERDSELLRLRARVEDLDAAIAAKEAQYRRLRDASPDPGAEVAPSRATPRP